MSVDNEAHDAPTEEVSVTVDGERVTATVEPRLKLSDFLRRECGKNGVRVGCEHGVCGACTVLLDGDSVKSCLLFAVQADGSAVTTAQGLAGEDGLHPIQEAFHEEHALQCGFCTSGFVVATKELLDDDPDPDREAIERGLADNICRCTGYQNVYDAVERAAGYLGDGDGTNGDGLEEDPDGDDGATDWEPVPEAPPEEEGSETGSTRGDAGKGAESHPEDADPGGDT